MADEITKKLMASSLKSLLSIFYDLGSLITKYAIDHVEIRSEHKGCVRIPFGEFDAQQVICVLERFDQIQKLMDCNHTCFAGRVVAVEEKKLRLGPAND